jgi:hypothetical protein
MSICWAFSVSFFPWERFDPRFCLDEVSVMCFFATPVQVASFRKTEQASLKRAFVDDKLFGIKIADLDS